MTRRALLPGALALSVAVVACEATPGELTCPTKAQSLTFSVAGSCSGGVTGTITILTQPGLCALTVRGGAAVGLPTQGQFWGTATASTGGYDLTKGNWYLFTDEGDTEDGSIEIICDVSVETTGVINLACSGSICPPDDCGGSSTCSYLDCAEHLTPSLN
jgi:hypothetical protein